MRVRLFFCCVFISDTFAPRKDGKKRLSVTKSFCTILAKLGGKIFSKIRACTSAQVERNLSPRASLEDLALGKAQTLVGAQGIELPTSK